MSKVTKLEDVKVRVIDTEQLKEIFDIDIPYNHRLNIKKYCVYENIFMIDTDAVFSEVPIFHHNNEVQQCLSFSCSFDERTENGWNVSVVRFEKLLSLEQFILLAKEINLIDFIRYNYNPRIISNQNILLEWIKDTLDC